MSQKQQLMVFFFKATIKRLHISRPSHNCSKTAILITNLLYRYLRKFKKCPIIFDKNFSGFYSCRSNKSIKKYSSMTCIGTSHAFHLTHFINIRILKFNNCYKYLKKVSQKKIYLFLFYF